MKTLTLESLELGVGAHTTRSSGLCVMEAVAWLAGERHSDRPECACPVIAAFARRFNDHIDHAMRQQLKAFVPKLVNSRATRVVEVRRALVAADHAVRVFAPLALEAHGFTDEAAMLRVTQPIVDAMTAEHAAAVAYAASNLSVAWAYGRAYKEAYSDGGADYASSVAKQVACASIVSIHAAADSADAARAAVTASADADAGAYAADAAASSAAAYAAIYAATAAINADASCGFRCIKAMLAATTPYNDLSALP